tara:strand:- start:1501 stop:1710 length:210 start_codon:yes stop_codon:yes gene_type:complete
VGLSTKRVNFPRLAKGHFIILWFSTRLAGIIFAFSIIKIEEKMINSKSKCSKRLEKSNKRIEKSNKRYL